MKKKRSRIKNIEFSEEGLKNIVGFLDTLKKIHIRLISEGLYN